MDSFKSSLLELDQILIDKGEREQRIKLLYTACRYLSRQLIKWDGLEHVDTTGIREQLDKYTNELRGYGCDV